MKIQIDNVDAFEIHSSSSSSSSSSIMSFVGWSIDSFATSRFDDDGCVCDDILILKMLRGTDTECVGDCG
jgi:hypothetical protein